MFSFKSIASVALTFTLLTACTTTRTTPPTVETPTEQSKAAIPSQTPESTTTAPTTESPNSSAVENATPINSNPITETNTPTSVNTNQSKLLQVNVFHFDYDSADLGDDALLALQAHAEYLQSHPKAKIQINGHTDSRGTREYNMALGERRAKSIASYLVAHSVNSTQIEVISFGEEKPLLDEESESAWAENRRAEIEYTQQKP